MSLTPAADDPNRDKELKRAKEDPKAFDADPSVKHFVPKDYDTSTSGLVADRDKPADSEEGADPWAMYLDQSVAVITEQLAELDDAQLETLLEAERAGKNRVTLIDAINNEVSTRGE